MLHGSVKEALFSRNKPLVNDGPFLWRPPFQDEKIPDQELQAIRSRITAGLAALRYETSFQQVDSYDSYDRREVLKHDEAAFSLSGKLLLRERVGYTQRRTETPFEDAESARS